jgi:hypothetical protein
MLSGSGANEPDQDDLRVQTQAVGIAFNRAESAIGAKRTTLALLELSPSVHALLGLMAGGNFARLQVPPDRYRCDPSLFQDRFDRHLTVVPGGACAA